MTRRSPLFLIAAFLLSPGLALDAEQSVSIEGGPADSGFNVGTPATIRATVRGLGEDLARYSVLADIQYVGTSAVSTVSMDRQPGGSPAEALYEGQWLIPATAPTGLYSVTVRVEDRSNHRVLAAQKLRPFAAFRKQIRIARVSLDKTFYSAGERIQCEVALENLTDEKISGLRVEFSNANYPWIALYGKEPQAGGLPAAAGKSPESPELALRVLRDRVELPARGQVTVPMMPAGTATFLQGAQVAVLGAGGPARHEKVPPPEVDHYTIAVWDAARRFLYDMQFSPQVIVRPPARDLPKPYSYNFTHTYNSDIDFEKYRHFYPPGLVSPAVSIGRERTLFRPGERVLWKVALKNPGNTPWKGLELRAEISDSSGRRVEGLTVQTGINLAPGETRSVESEVWSVPTSAAPGVYSLKLSLIGPGENCEAATTTEIAVNALAGPLMVFSPHEDDEHAYAGLIRATLEAGLPVRVVVLTGGDVGACERYYSKPCGPNEAREFGLVRMEETAEALEHIGLAREHLTFLGLPDGGSEAIWFQHPKSSDPFLSIYLASDHAPYESILKPNLPYARDAVLEQVKQLIAEFHPAVIATTHPDERHVDHRVTSWFVLKACQELFREKKVDSSLTVLVDRAYGAGGFKPAPFQYDRYPAFLSGEAATLKQEMGWIYQSQDGNLAEGMRKTLSDLPRQEVHYRVTDWPLHEGWNESNGP